MVEISCNQGDKNAKVAFVFSCPGQKEEKENKLVAGMTGKNLNCLISCLRNNHGLCELFPSEDRYYYRITNASTKIHYEAKNGLSEPTDSEIVDEKNLERLCNDLQGFDYVITFGRKAEFAVSKLEIDSTIINVKYHLGLRGINNIKFDVHGCELKVGEKGNTEKRLACLALKIAEQIQNTNCTE